MKNRKKQGIAPIQGLCLNCFRKQHPIINIVVAGNFAAVVSVEFYDLREIVVDCIEFEVLFATPFDSFRQSLSGAAGPEYQPAAFPPTMPRSKNQKIENFIEKYNGYLITSLVCNEDISKTYVAQYIKEHGMEKVSRGLR